jgi:peptide deformylase
MTVLKLRFYPDPVLKEVAKPVETFDGELKKFLDDMAETMYTFQGIGLAANQVGVTKRVFVVDTSRTGGKPQFFINPEIIDSAEPILFEEGCLSIPDFRERVKRFRCVRIKAQNAQGEYFEQDAEDLEAVAYQHELDHLNGVLFVDKLSQLKKQMFLKWFRKNQPLGGE